MLSLTFIRPTPSLRHDYAEHVVGLRLPTATAPDLIMALISHVCLHLTHVYLYLALVFMSCHVQHSGGQLLWFCFHISTQPLALLRLNPKSYGPTFCEKPSKRRV